MCDRCVLGSFRYRTTPGGINRQRRAAKAVTGQQKTAPNGAARHWPILAPVTKALTWQFSPDQSCFHVHSARLCAPRVLRSQRTVSTHGGPGPIRRRRVPNGTSGIGAGQPGGEGIRLDWSRPIRLDAVAAAHSALTVVAAHFGWPWHMKLVAMALHKTNVYIDVSGWSPRGFRPGWSGK